MKLSLEKSEVVLETPAARGRRFSAEFGLETVFLEIAPGGVIPGHVLDVPVAFFVLEGEGFLRVDGMEESARPNDYLTVASGANRCWQNPGADSLKVLVIKQMRK